MDHSFYPPLDAGSVTAVRAALSQVRRHPDWLASPGCPYDEATRLGLTELLRALPPASSAPDEPQAPVDDADRYTALESDANSMLKELRELLELLPKADVKERLTGYRVATTLMEKLIDLGERASSLREMSQFQRGVLKVFDTVLTPAQRTQALRLLEIEAQ